MKQKFYDYYSSFLWDNQSNLIRNLSDYKKSVNTGITYYSEIA